MDSVANVGKRRRKQEEERKNERGGKGRKRGNKYFFPIYSSDIIHAYLSLPCDYSWHGNWIVELHAPLYFQAVREERLELDDLPSPT